MRHVGTLIAAIVIAPLAWILLAFGQDRSAEAFARAQTSGAFHTGDFARPLEYLAAAGLLLGLLATLRFSPLGALLTGLGYVSSYALLLVAPSGVLSLFRHSLSIAGHRADPTMPIRTGTTMVLGTLMLVGVASVGRWRRWPRQVADSPGTVLSADRPLGADGLGLTASNDGAEPEFAARYATTAHSAMASSGRSRDSDW